MLQLVGKGAAVAPQLERIGELVSSRPRPHSVAEAAAGTIDLLTSRAAADDDAP
jgi:hypothetical protein